MSNVTKNQKVGIFGIMFIAAALIGSVVAVSEDNSAAFATKIKSNDSLQDITQESFTGESSECFSNNNTLASCNNVALSLNANDGNNAAGQQ
ncbi:MAG TPA: hypothetical protein VJU13_04295 [Candidatus Nitrosocosmicus sp.]|nr:hypothetical protein [Candidatus Nitrosocosmicus sp.]